MLRSLGVLFLAVTAALLGVWIETKLGVNSVKSIIQSQSLQIMASALALNVATVTFVISILVNIEQKVPSSKTELFTRTRRELKHNIFTMALLLILEVFVAIAIDGHIQINQWLSLQQVLSFAGLTILFIFCGLVLEVSLLVLRVRAIK